MQTIETTVIKSICIEKKSKNLSSKGVTKRIITVKKLQGGIEVPQAVVNLAYLLAGAVILSNHALSHVFI